MGFLSQTFLIHRTARERGETTLVLLHFPTPFFIDDSGAEFHAN